MSWLVVARKDFQDAVRSKTLWAVTVVFVLLTAGPAYVLGWLSGGLFGARLYMGYLVPAASFVVSLVALLVGYRSIVGERDTGTVKLLLALPHSRRDVLLGKVAGRFAVVGVAAAIAFGLTALILYGSLSGFPAGAYLVFVGLTLTFALTFVALAVGLSASADSSSTVAAGAFGLYAAFAFNVWNWLANVLNYLATGQFFFRDGRPGWAEFFRMLNPTIAYGRAVEGFLPGGGGTGTPAYLSEWAAVGVLLLWIAVALGVGYWRFASAEI